VTAPTIPLIADFNTSIEYKSQVLQTQPRKGGLEQKASRGIHRVRQSMDVQVGIRTLEERDAIDQFLKVNARKPFRFNYDGKSHSELWVCSSFDWVYSGTAWIFNGTFEQAFRYRV
jgi:phage-related protein